VLGCLKGCLFCVTQVTFPPDLIIAMSHFYHDGFALGISIWPCLQEKPWVKKTTDVHPMSQFSSSFLFIVV
jgi:hypothetical protein